MARINLSSKCTKNEGKSLFQPLQGIVVTRANQSPSAPKRGKRMKETVSEIGLQTSMTLTL